MKFVWVRLVLLMVAVLGVGNVLSLPWRSLEPHQILLKNLSPEKLDSILDQRLAELEDDLAKTYEDELMLHEEMVASMQQTQNRHHIRRRRQATFDPREDSEKVSFPATSAEDPNDGTSLESEFLSTIPATTKVLLSDKASYSKRSAPNSTRPLSLDEFDTLTTDNSSTDPTPIDYLETEFTNTSNFLQSNKTSHLESTLSLGIEDTLTTDDLATDPTQKGDLETELTGPTVLTTEDLQNETTPGMETITLATDIPGTKSISTETTTIDDITEAELYLDTEADFTLDVTEDIEAYNTKTKKPKLVPTTETTNVKTEPYFITEATTNFEEVSYEADENVIAPIYNNDSPRLPRAYIPPQINPYEEDELWHSSLHFTDELGNRDELKVEAVRVSKKAEDIKIDATFPLNLWNLTAIYRDEAGFAYRLVGEELQQIMVKNNWTSQISGCICPHDPYQLCACCRVGACACPSHPNTCVPCPIAHDQNTCNKEQTQALLVDSVTGFQYFTGYYDEVDGLQRVLVVSWENTVTFYSIDDDGAEHFSPQHGLTTLSFSRKVTHLGYGESYQDVDGVIEKVRFLVCFRREESIHQLQTITINNQVALGESVSWEAKGSEMSEMKTWQSGGRVLIGVKYYTSIDIYEIKANHRHQYRVRIVQTINTTLPIVHWSTFSLGFDNILMLVTRHTASIYQLAGVTYQHIQDLHPSDGLTDFRAIIPISAPWWRGKVVLLAGERKRVLAYVWNGPSRTIKVDHVTDLSLAVSDWSVSLAYTEGVAQGSEFVVVQGVVGPVIISVQTRLKDLPDPVLLQTKRLQEAISALEAEFERQTRVVEATHNYLNRSLEVDDVILGNIVVTKGIHVNGTLNTGEIKTVKISVEDPDAHANAVAHYQSILTDLNNTVINLHTKLNDAVPKSGSTRLITGIKTIAGATLHAEVINADQIIVSGTLDGNGIPFPLNNILRGLVRRGHRQVIEGKKTFTQTITVDDLMTKFLGGVPVSDLVTTDEDHTITAATSFVSPLLAQKIEVAPGGTVGGIDLSEVVVPLNGNSTIGGCVFKQDVIVNSLTTLSRFINGVDLNRISNSALTVEGGTILGSLTFTNSLTVNKLNATRIMGVDIAKFMSTTVFRNRPATLHGKLTASSVEIRGDLTVEGLINGRNFPDDYPLQTDTNISFGPKRFMSVSVNTLTVGPGALIDGVPLDKLVTLHTLQTITGHKTFAQGVYIEGNLDITSKILDGVNLDQLNASVQHVANTDWKYNVIFKKSVTVPALNCKGTLNGIDFVAFANDVVYNDEPIVISSNKIFKNGLTVTNATFHSTFNGVGFSNLVTTANSATRGISGSKVFSGDVTFNDLNVGSLGGVNIEELVGSAVYLNKPGQVVVGTKILTNTLRTQKLVVTGKIGDVDFTKIVTKSTDQTFTVAQSLRSANFTDLEAIELEMPFGATVNNIDLASLYNRRISLTSPGFYTGLLTVQGPVSVLDSITVGYLNGRRTDTIAKDFVMKDEFSVISSDLTFKNLTVLGPITTENKAGANGLNISDIDRLAVKVTSNQVLTTNMRWSQITFRSDVEVHGLVDGVDLLALGKDVVLKNSTNVQIITGEKRYEGGITVQGDIDATTVNGIDLSSKLLTRNTPQVISAPYSFHNVDVKGELVLLGTYNGLDLSSLIPVFQGPVYRGDVTFHGDVSVGNLKLTGTYNGIDVEKRLSDAIPLTGDEVVVKGRKYFKADTIFTKVDIHHLNVVPLSRFLRHLVLRDRESKITGFITVPGEVTAPLVAARETFVEGTIGGVDYNKLVSEAAYINKNHTFTTTLTLNGDLVVNGELNIMTLNGVRVFDFLTTNTEQIIHNHFTINTATSSDVLVQGLVNSYKLPEEIADTMKVVGGQTLQGSITLAGQVEVLGDVHVTGKVGTTSKVDLSSQAVFLHQQTEILGSLEFKIPIVTSSLTVLPGFVSGVNLPHLLQSAWFIDQPTIVSGDLLFLQPVIFKKNVILNQRNDTPSEDLILDLVNTTLDNYNTMSAELTQAFRNTCNSVVPLYNKLQNSIYDIGFFQNVGEGSFQYPQHSSITFTAFKRSFMVVSWGGGGRCQSTWFELSVTPTRLRQFATGSAAHAGWGDNWRFLGEYGNNAYVAVAGSNDDGCGNSGSVILKINSEARIEVHRTLVPGNYLSISGGSGGADVVRLQVHSQGRTTTYRFSLSSGSLHQNDQTQDTVDHSTSLLTRGNTQVTFRSSGRHGRVYVSGVGGEEVVVERSIDGCALMEGSAGRLGGEGPILLLLSVTREDKMHNQEHILELSLVNPVNGTLTWMDLRIMGAKTHFTTFRVGPSHRGSWVIVAVQEGGLPVVYTLIGESLKEVAYLSTVGVTWMQHLSVPAKSTSLNLSFPTHYLLLGHNSSKFLLARLVMNGLTVPPTNITSCDLATGIELGY